MTIAVLNAEQIGSRASLGGAGAGQKETTKDDKKVGSG